MSPFLNLIFFKENTDVENLCKIYTLEIVKANMILTLNKLFN